MFTVNHSSCILSLQMSLSASLQFIKGENCALRIATLPEKNYTEENGVVN